MQRIRKIGNVTYRSDERRRNRIKDDESGDRRVDEVHADDSLPPNDLHVIPDNIFGRGFDVARGHIHGFVRCDGLTGHVGSELGVELDEGRVHGIQALGAGLHPGDGRIHFL